MRLKLSAFALTTAIFTFGSFAGDTLITQIHSLASNTNVSGVAVFSKTKDEVVITGHIKGLVPNMYHGLHIHTYGDLTDFDKRSADHFDPSGDGKVRQAGDLGNIRADEKGEASFVVRTGKLKISEGERAVIGRMLMVHAGRDLGVGPRGGSGVPIAGGIIGRAHPNSTVIRRFDNGYSLIVPKDIDPDAVYLTDDTVPVAAKLENSVENVGERVKNGMSNIGEALQNVGKAIENNIEQ